MSGPVTPKDFAVDVHESRTVELGGITVRRLLPKRQRRTIGAWCFLDHIGPADVAMAIGPHPHAGLHTVTWLLDGEVLHRDSLGTEQPIRPGQLNLMTAGHGVSHAEEGRSDHVHGVQLWVAQPDATRHGDPAFEHHGVLPVAEHEGVTATVLIGALAGAASPSRADTPLVGADLAVRAPTSLPIDPAFEHGVIALDAPLSLGDEVVEPGHLGYLAPGCTELPLAPVDGPVRALLVGGEPFGPPPLMWWNFVARTWDEVDAARLDWNGADTDRFGDPGSRLDRIPAPPR